MHLTGGMLELVHVCGVVVGGLIGMAGPPGHKSHLTQLGSMQTDSLNSVYQQHSKCLLTPQYNLRTTLGR